MTAGRTHKECANYSNGYCRLFNVHVDPNGPACPNFTPRTKPTLPKATMPPAVVGGLRGTYRQQTLPAWGYGAERGWWAGQGTGLGLGMRHRHRHGRGRWRWLR